MNNVLKVGCIPYSSFRIVIIKPLNKSVSSTKQKTYCEMERIHAILGLTARYLNVL